MKFFKTQNKYKASNVIFDTKLVEAYSYGHWLFVAKINGLVVFNNYSYSITTSAHQRKVRSLMRELGIKIDLVVESRASLSSSDWQDETLENYFIKIDALDALIETKGTRKSKNLERQREIKVLDQKIKELQNFITNNAAQTA